MSSSPTAAPAEITNTPVAGGFQNNDGTASMVPPIHPIDIPLTTLNRAQNPPTP